jgi:hypothetical protein
LRTKQATLRALVGVLICAALIGAGLNLNAPVEAAPPAQGGTLTFTDVAPATGTLDATTAEVQYEFQCVATGLASVVAETTSGDLETEIAVSAVLGGTVAEGGVVRSNPNVSAAEAFEMPADGACRVTLRRVGNTSGGYALRLLPGFAHLDKYDMFDGPDTDTTMTWEPYASDSMTVATVGQRLQIQVFADNLLSYAVPTGDDITWGDFYVQADYEILGNPSYYEYGFVLRLDNEADLFYSLTFSSDGDWSLYWFNGEWNALQPWTVSPLIDGAAKTPTVGAEVQGNTFRAYFNGKLVGEVSDPNSSAGEGTLGVVAATGVDQTDPVIAFIDNVIITTPVKAPATGLPFGGLGGDDDDNGTQPSPTPGGGLGALFGGSSKNTPTPSAPPTQAPLLPPTATPAPTQAPQTNALTTWNSGSPKQIVAELVSLGLVPAGGAVALTIPDSFGDTSSSGFSFYPLGQGREFRNFVLAYDATLSITGPESGCGMFFRDAASVSSDALVFEDGYYLLGEWDASGNLSDSSYYEFSDAVNMGEGARNHVVIVAYEADVTLFVNGQLVTQAQFTPTSGSLALEVYVNEDDFGATQRTYCDLSDIWLWEF